MSVVQKNGMWNNVQSLLERRLSLLKIEHLLLGILFLIIMVAIVFAPAPTQGTPILNSTRGTNLTSENLTVYNISTADSDGDPVYNIYNWYRNQTSFLVLNMPFENNTINASNSTRDYSPYQNNGTVDFGARFNKTGGYDGNGTYIFDGDDDAINIANAASLNPGAGVTFEVWINTNHTTNVTFMAKQGQYELHAGSTSAVPDAVPAFEISNGGNNQTVFANTTQINDSRWHHIVGVFIPNQDILLYVDGVNRSINYTNVGTTPLSSIATTTNGFRIGKSPRGNSMNGSIDSARIWNASLSSAQILALYSNMTNTIVEEETVTGERWNASITPNDGFSDGITSFTTNVTIVANNVPTHGTPILNSTLGTNLTTENLTVYNVSTYDPDGNSTKNIYNWFRNNTPLLMLYLPFEGHAGDEAAVAKDYSPYQRNGTVSQNANYNSTAGYGGAGAYDFDATTTQDIAVTHTNLGNPQGSFTLTAWARITGQNSSIAQRGIAGKFSGQQGFALVYSDNKNTSLAVIGNGTHNITHGGPSWNISQWHFVALVYDARNADTPYAETMFYDNGVLRESSEATNISFTTGDFLVGRISSTERFNGTIDEVQLWNRSLSADQILVLYNNRTNVMDAGDEIVVGDIWNASITPNDGADDGVTRYTTNVTIANTAPTHGTPILNSTLRTNTTRENLTVYNISTADGDVQSIKNIYNWYRNQTSVLVLNIPFEDNTTGTFAKDYSPFQNNISQSGNGETYNASGGYDGFGAMQFGGTSADFSADRANSLNLSTFTLEGRIYVRSTARNGTILSNYMGAGGSPTGAGYGLVYENGIINFTVGNGTAAGQSITSTTSLSLNTWYHTVATFNGTNMSLYINGVHEASRTFAGTYQLSTGLLFVGTNSITTYNLNGSLDELRIWNMSISAEQASALFNNRTDRIHENDTFVGETWNASITPFDGMDDGPRRYTTNLTIVASCGDSVVEGTESCDGTNLNGATCISQGFAAGGTLSCSASCTFVTSLCSAGGTGPSTPPSSGDDSGGGSVDSSGPISVSPSAAPAPTESGTPADTGAPADAGTPTGTGTLGDTSAPSTPAPAAAAPVEITVEETMTEEEEFVLDIEEAIVTTLFGKQPKFLVESITFDGAEVYDELGQTATLPFKANSAVEITLAIINEGERDLHNLYVDISNLPVGVTTNDLQIIDLFKAGETKTLRKTLTMGELTSAFDVDIYISTTEDQQLIKLKGLYEYSVINRYFTKEKIVRQTKTYVKYSYTWILILLLIPLILVFMQSTTFADEQGIRNLMLHNKLLNYRWIYVPQKTFLRYPSIRNLKAVHPSTRDAVLASRLKEKYGIDYELATLTTAAKHKLFSHVITTKEVPLILKKEIKKVTFLNPEHIHQETVLQHYIKQQLERGVSHSTLFSKLIESGWDHQIVKKHLGVKDREEQLEAYIKTQRAKHVSDAIIIQRLKEAGWHELIIQEYINPYHNLRMYIKEKDEAGIPMKGIKARLLKVGWKKEVVAHELNRYSIRKYIKSQIRKGVKEALIAKKLINAGWSKALAYELLDEEELESYLKKEKQRGFKRELVELALLLKGWRKEFVEKYLKYIFK